MRITGIRRRLRVRGQLTEEHLGRLQWAAAHCPVSNTLESAVEIRTDVVIAEA